MTEEPLAKIRKVEIVEHVWPNRDKNQKVFGVKFSIGSASRPFQWVWYPEFYLIAELLQRKGAYEDERYPDGKGRKMLKEYISRAIDGENIEELNKEYKIPSERKPYK